jgi:hypothetical protein
MWMFLHFLIFVRFCLDPFDIRELVVMRIRMLTKAVDALNVRDAKASSEADEASNGHMPTQHSSRKAATRENFRWKPSIDKFFKVSDQSKCLVPHIGMFAAVPRSMLLGFVTMQVF